MFSQKINLLHIDGINIKSIIEKNNIYNLENHNILNIKIWNKNNKIYKIVKYNKDNINTNNLFNAGIFRSLIISNGKINVFSPPKSLNKEIFFSLNNEKDCIAEEFIEGTMINLFYDFDIQKWEITTKTSVGAKVSFFKDQPNFSDLFWEICRDFKIKFDNLPKDLCYSFVMQHPKNKFVVQIKKKSLYLITAYKIDNNTYDIMELSRDEILSLNLVGVKYPHRFTFETYKEIILNYGSNNANTNICGIVIRNKNGDRTKINNPNYEYIKNIRGNHSKLQYQYLYLRNIGKVKEYLHYFPEHREKFNIYRKHLHDFTDTLHINYITCFVNKHQKLENYPYQFKPHMYELHQKYMILKNENKCINKDVIINYVNTLHPAKLMYSLNYHLRDVSKKNIMQIEDTNYSNRMDIN